MTDKSSTPAPAGSLYKQSRAYIDESSPERLAAMSKVITEEVATLGMRLFAASEEHDLNMTILLSSAATLILFGVARVAAENQKARTIEFVQEVTEYVYQSLLNMALARWPVERTAAEEPAK